MKRSIQIIFRIAALAAAGSLLCSATVRAEESDQPQCYKGQYVLARSAPAKDRLSIEALDEVSAVDLQVRGQTKSAILVEEVSTVSAMAGKSERDRIEPESSRNLCGKLWRKHRGDRFIKRMSGAATVLRRPNCDCNGVLNFSATPVPTLTPNDGYFYQQWGVHNPGNDIDMNLPEAWAITRGNPNVVVGIIDTGIDYNHPDLQGNLWQNPGEIAGNGVDDDANGYVDDVYGINAINNTGNPFDDNGHGTHVAGTIGAVGNNAIGVVGVNWQVKLAAAKFLSSTGSGGLYDATKAIDYFTALKNRGVPIVATNNSWGGGGYYQTLYDSIRRARDAGLLFVAAAGNSGQNIDASPSYPASYDLNNIISVAAIDNNGNLASFSNYGASNTDIAAPGVNIASTYPQNRYVNLNGTSMACPHVTGAIALLASYANSLTWQQLRDNLFANRTPMSNLQGVVATAGRVNCYAMLMALSGNPPPPSSPWPSPSAPPSPAPSVIPSVSPTSTPTPSPSRSPSPSPSPEASPKMMALTVHVVTSGGDVLPQTRIEVLTPAGNYFKYTDANGNAAFNIWGPVNYTMVASKSGFTFPSIGGRLSVPMHHDVTADPKQFMLRGIVMDKYGATLAGVTVSDPVLGTKTTDDLGRFNFPVTYGFRYRVSISAPGLVFSESVLNGVIYGNVTRTVVGEED